MTYMLRYLHRIVVSAGGLSRYSPARQKDSRERKPGADGTPARSLHELPAACKAAVPTVPQIVGEGEVGGPIYTLCDGWAARYRRLPDGSRQIFDILPAGDMIGLESPPPVPQR